MVDEHVSLTTARFFSHLEPLDLLHLARSSKLIRSYLMSKIRPLDLFLPTQADSYGEDFQTSASVWIAARKNAMLGVLHPFPEQSEPRWARLIFEERCMVRALGESPFAVLLTQTYVPSSSA